jgi:hypothetical protein
VHVNWRVVIAMLRVLSVCFESERRCGFGVCGEVVE